ncbi:hypothetical protein G9A89_021779 [Geosiphon pyriformis]|nr:hypothetical protein G9A89_021779 [Geosiphon pyriformis]
MPATPRKIRKSARLARMTVGYIPRKLSQKPAKAKKQGQSISAVAKTISVNSARSNSDLNRKIFRAGKLFILQNQSKEYQSTSSTKPSKDQKTHKYQGEYKSGDTKIPVWEVWTAEERRFLIDTFRYFKELRHQEGTMLAKQAVPDEVLPFQDRHNLLEINEADKEVLWEEEKLEELMEEKVTSKTTLSGCTFKSYLEGKSVPTEGYVVRAIRNWVNTEIIKRGSGN